MLDVKALLTKILDALKVDYVVEKGTVGDWSYRKWKSGIAEAWIANLSLGSQTPSVWVSPVRYKDMSSIALPTGVFTNTPTVTAVSATNQWWVVDMNATSTTSATARFATLASSAQTITVNIYARG